MTVKPTNPLIKALRRAVGLPNADPGCCATTRPGGEASRRPSCCDDRVAPSPPPSADADRTNLSGPSPASSRPVRPVSCADGGSLVATSALPVVRLPR